MSEPPVEPTGRRRSRRARRGAEQADPTDVSALPTALAGLMGALDAGREHLPADEIAAAEAVIAKAARRLELTGGHTVAALAGATGSGKSSLFNVLAGAAVSTVGRRRPTTTATSAAVWGDGPAGELLDWVGAPTRYRVSGEHAAPGLDGLVLLDLPDIDSTRAAHRDEADRVLALADVFVWVTDPQKYADALIHDEYLAAARDHAAVTLVLLNQADRLSPSEASACRDELRRLLAADGLPDAEIILTSATTGLGMADLLFALRGAVSAQIASRARLLGDIRASARRLRESVADAEPRVSERPDDALLDALARTAGVPTVLAAVEADHRRRAAAATGWPPTRWVRRLRAEPLRRVRVGASSPGEDEPDFLELERLVARSSLPGPTPTARAGLERLTRRLGELAGDGLPEPWARAVADAAAPTQADLADALDRAVLAAPLQRRTSWWWGPVRFLHVVLLLAAIAGAGWLLALAGLAWLQLPVPDPPRFGILPLPTILLVLGLVGGILLAALSRALAKAGARRARDRARRALAESIGAVAREHLLEPMAAVVGAHARTRVALDEALTGAAAGPAPARHHRFGAPRAGR
ncbi:GTPase [Agilicoccus flavus]|uniref:GTPase n=1 Tax=Agilicoccus flavus TaxID=2775968 RepID=UPI001CF6FB7B|nr:GTPase [Agilicoccus flavus]